jgi:hypothetical protein
MHIMLILCIQKRLCYAYYFVCYLPMLFILSTTKSIYSMQATVCYSCYSTVTRHDSRSEGLLGNIVLVCIHVATKLFVWWRWEWLFEEIGFETVFGAKRMEKYVDASRHLLEISHFFGA